MTFVFFIAALLALLFVWGLFWPRSLWRVMASWSRRNPQASEPGPVSYGLQRVVSAIGLASFAAVGVFLAVDYVQSLPQPEPKPTALQAMWGSAPAPLIVDRVVNPSGETDPSFAAEPILAYQAVDSTAHTPRYLAFLSVYQPPGPPDRGYIGSTPGTGFAALDSAELVINLRPKTQCVPMQATVIETETAVQIGVVSGLPGQLGGATADNAFCAGGSIVGPSLLLPLNLSAPLGDRQVQMLDGTPILEVPPAE
ncbi:hypothetical protein FB562_0350 [Homoserinimonas aerilata]|uniref:DUF6199 domain-containing protein n=1 Tax=Homoserinimonas aerilata TaxID=1162970 RepID=A0A542YH34_9MICO|nr:hypothetical protein [Homoserinimonas aerilata]TQL47294.1 hypothetical protein FB562_0350 [Homoserinimonas aerilata]